MWGSSQNPNDPKVAKKKYVFGDVTKSLLSSATKPKSVAQAPENGGDGGYAFGDYTRSFIGASSQVVKKTVTSVCEKAATNPTASLDDPIDGREKEYAFGDYTRTLVKKSSTIVKASASVACEKISKLHDLSWTKWDKTVKSNPTLRAMRSISYVLRYYSVGMSLSAIEMLDSNLNPNQEEALIAGKLQNTEVFRHIAAFTHLRRSMDVAYASLEQEDRDLMETIHVAFPLVYSGSFNAPALSQVGPEGRPVRCLDELLRQAEIAKVIFDGELMRIAADLSLPVTRCQPEPEPEPVQGQEADVMGKGGDEEAEDDAVECCAGDGPPAGIAACGVLLLPLKIRDRAQRKVLTKYTHHTDLVLAPPLRIPVASSAAAARRPGGTSPSPPRCPGASRVLDAVRASVVCASAADMACVLQRVWGAPHFRILRLKNRFLHPTPTGYRDIVLHIAVDVDESAEGGQAEAIVHVCELQIHLKSLHNCCVENGFPAIYEFFHAYFACGAGAGDDEETTRAVVERRADFLLQLAASHDITNSRSSSSGSDSNTKVPVDALVEAQAQGPSGDLVHLRDLFMCLGEPVLGVLVQRTLYARTKAACAGEAIDGALNTETGGSQGVPPLGGGSEHPPPLQRACAALDMAVALRGLGSNSAAVEIRSLLAEAAAEARQSIAEPDNSETETEVKAKAKAKALLLHALLQTVWDGITAQDMATDGDFLASLECKMAEADCLVEQVYPRGRAQQLRCLLVRLHLRLLIGAEVPDVIARCDELIDEVNSDFGDDADLVTSAYSLRAQIFLQTMKSMTMEEQSDVEVAAEADRRLQTALDMSTLFCGRESPQVLIAFVERATTMVKLNLLRVVRDNQRNANIFEAMAESVSLADGARLMDEACRLCLAVRGPQCCDALYLRCLHASFLTQTLRQDFDGARATRSAFVEAKRAAQRQRNFRSHFIHRRSHTDTDAGASAGVVEVIQAVMQLIQTEGVFKTVEVIQQSAREATLVGEEEEKAYKELIDMFEVPFGVPRAAILDTFEASGKQKDVAVERLGLMVSQAPPLFAAVMSGSVESARAQIDLYGEAAVRDPAEVLGRVCTPLEFACARGEGEIVAIMLPLVPLQELNELLLLCLSHERTPISVQVVRAGSLDLHRNDPSIFMSVFETGNVEMFQELIAVAAEVGQPFDPLVYSPLMEMAPLAIADAETASEMTAFLASIGVTRRLEMQDGISLDQLRDKLVDRIKYMM